MESLIDLVRDAQNIGIASGDAMAPCIQAWQEATGIEVPPFKNERLDAASQGRSFWNVRGFDVAGMVKSGWLDAGVAGTDACVEAATDCSLQFLRVGRPMCYFALLADMANDADVRRRLIPTEDNLSVPLRIPTTNPALLRTVAFWRNLGIAPLNGPQISGKGEAVARLSGMGCVADIVKSGRTAQANGLNVVLKLCDIYPELVVRL